MCEKPMMKQVCSYCKECYGEIECSPEQVGRVTHGICTDCYDREMKKIDDIINHSKGGDIT